MEVIIPIITAVIGLIGGFGIAIYKEKQTNKRTKDSLQQVDKNQNIQLAKDLLEMEFERAKTKGLDSPYSTIAHLIVLEQLINDQLKSSVHKNLKEVTEAINEEYKMRCWPNGFDVQAQNVVHESIQSNDRELTNSEFIESLKILLRNEIENK